MIELRKVSKVYDDGAAVCRALQEVDLTIEKGEMTAIEVLFLFRYLLRQEKVWKN